MLAVAAAAGYLAYAAMQEEKMGDARYHNMERQVLALAKKNKGTVTVADLINVGFESDEAEKTLDTMAKKGICDINLDATAAVGHHHVLVPRAHTARKIRGHVEGVNMNCRRPIILLTLIALALALSCARPGPDH